MTNSVVLLIALIIIASIMVIALMPRTKFCTIDVQFSLQNGIKITFGTKEFKATKPKMSKKNDKTNANPPKDKR
ncbi:hypothetical protein [Clostridium saccharoperbutylacetonicum]|uniref:hypothetical protein n=1 Tax=Clostridium saccharoperbutylacetonicum TaxID=36745 RepID=UPI000983F4E5|nr:hypothetical protein [Clostridium saccharoperbutylacetonicum]AQR93401.1 hypothetical protein CLSAP_06990 [Clostridium saccharoperbutylacetonicum]NSB29098.1 hypothetical protein [Clostridium saccharoperbutylacetonicum]